MSTDFRGDPSAALLEVLDPEQNFCFNDHYLDLDYDLSKVMFICTANTMHDIPLPLQDRMEIIRLAGYTELEKLAIAKRYLIPKQQELNGLEHVPVTWKRSALRALIHNYTREAGVRSLEREIGAICRKIAKDVLKNGQVDGKSYLVNVKLVQKYLGPPRFRYGTAEEQDQVGLTTGLAWTELGGELLTIEATVMPGKGKLIITGKLGEVMQESAQAAMSYVRSRAELLGLDKRFLENVDIHVHVPEGAIPKDGPSAGVTMATALVSALCHVPVRKDVAMTGEITLRGRVLPIGGLKEKMLAAHRGGIKRVLIPRENVKDIRGDPQEGPGRAHHHPGGERRRGAARGAAAPEPGGLPAQAGAPAGERPRDHRARLSPPPPRRWRNDAGPGRRRRLAPDGARRAGCAGVAAARRFPHRLPARVASRRRGLLARRAPLARRGRPHRRPARARAAGRRAARGVPGVPRDVPGLTGRCPEMTATSSPALALPGQGPRGLAAAPRRPGGARLLGPRPGASP